MPTIIPGYVYSLFAALVVGTIVVSSCSLSTVNIRNEAKDQQLANVDKYVAAQGLTLLTHLVEDNQNVTQFLAIPSQIGNQRFWIRITNDSSSSWVESGFGTTAFQSDQRIYIPAEITASGIFVSGSGRAILQCSRVNQAISLTLTQE